MKRFAILAILLTVSLLVACGGLSRSKAASLIQSSRYTFADSMYISIQIGTFVRSSGIECFHPSKEMHGWGENQELLLEKLGYITTTYDNNKITVRLTPKGEQFLLGTKSKPYDQNNSTMCNNYHIDFPIADPVFDKVTGITGDDLYKTVITHYLYSTTSLAKEITKELRYDDDSIEARRVRSQYEFGLNVNGNTAALLLEHGQTIEYKFRKFDDGWRMVVPTT